MFKHYFEQIEGISRYPIFSLLVFITFFICMFWWVAATGKAYVDHMRNLPLEEDTNNTIA